MRTQRRLRVLEVVAPSHWASYFINGDSSGMESDDKMQADMFLDRQGLGSPVSCENAGFRWRHDAMPECPLGSDCQTYVFLY